MHKESGFTLIELLIVIGIIGILAAVAIPNYMASLPRNRLNRAVQELHSDLQRVRLAAVKDRLNCNVAFNELNPPRYTFTCGNISKTVDLTEYGSDVHFERPSTCSGGAVPAGGITFNAQGMSGINAFAYMTNSARVHYYRVGVLSSGVVLIDSHTGGCSWN